MENTIQTVSPWQNDKVVLFKKNVYNPTLFAGHKKIILGEKFKPRSHKTGLRATGPSAHTSRLQDFRLQDFKTEFLLLE